MRLICLEIEISPEFKRMAREFPDGLAGDLGPIAWALNGPIVR